MGFKHFSHKHNLIPIESEGNEKLDCGGCEKTIFKPFHGCKQCKFYIHDECLNAPRWLKHPSHPSHTLVLQPSPTYSIGAFNCNACNYRSSALSFSCVECDFDIHPHCANSPATIRLEAHPHELKLMYANPDYHGNTALNCNVCGKTASHKNWLYYCSPCGFHAHLNCAISDKHFGWVTTVDSIPNDRHDDSTPHTGCVVHNKQQQQNQSMIDSQVPSQPTSGSSASVCVASAIDAAKTNLIKEAVNELMEAQTVIVKSQMDQMRMLTKMLNQL